MSYVQPLHRSVDRARQLRKELTPPEVKLWMALRRRGVANLKFRRQHPIGPFIVDFFCPSAGLVVEVDGQIHTWMTNPARDDRRDLWLENHGLTILRIPATYVRDNLDAVLRGIGRAAERAAAGR